MLFLRHLPNVLTALRLAAAPLTAYLILSGEGFAALIVFVLAGLSDALDGFLARRFSLTTQFGGLLDPAADKLLMLLVLLALSANQAVPLWLAVLIIGRDIAIVLALAIAFILSLPLRIQPLLIGKISTVVQVCYIALLLLLGAFGLDLPQVTQAAAVVTGAVTLTSWAGYFLVWLRAFSLRQAA
jgi:cardiolipin synthase